MAKASLGGAAVSHPTSAEPDSPYLAAPAVRLRRLSVERYGAARALEIVGQSPAVARALEQVEKIARYREPVLVTGESGVGKEQFAHALYLLGCGAGRPYVTVNCPQYQDGNLTVSELFGHRKGSFTGAVSDRRGAFEEADGGVIFLDEIGDLQSSVQALLLRALATGEFRPLGATTGRSADVRVVSATNRDLNDLVMTSQFRYDLFFRLRHFLVDLPPLRERGDDWRLIADHTLNRLARKYGVARRLSPASLALLERCRWPGNVRQLIAVVSTGYGMADADWIDSRYRRVTAGSEDFWSVVGQPFLDRDLNRAEVKAIMRRALAETSGSYNKVLALFHLPAQDYHRFMDFLRHHDLKS
jgi:transcriptional regulator with GAF, ATPase, and Fis domain